MKRRTPSKYRFRRLNCEPLEKRLTMNGDSANWLNAQSLTLSFAPDGTSVSGESSALEKTMTDASLTQWRETIVRAFQTWAQKASINIGIVEDGGEPLGIRGVSHDDQRFGDIRIAGVPLSPDTLGEAIHESRTMVGTWAGDVVFNTRVSWTSEADLFSVALHEAGHVLGLEHSAEPLSPMFKHGISQTAGPTAGDVAALQSVYGARRADIYEGAQGNETISRATRIPHSEASDGFNGATPLVVYGDIGNSTDKDVFELPVLLGCQGPLTFELVTKGISLLSGRMTLLDRHGNVLRQVSTAASLGDKVALHLSSATEGKYYIQIDAATTDAFSSGAYAVVTKYDPLLTTSAADIDKSVLQGFRWQARTDDNDAAVDVRKLLDPSGSPQLDNDLHQDDSVSTAVTLQATLDTPAVKKFQFVGTISDAVDVDLFRLRSQSAPSALRGLTVSVESLEMGGLIPAVTLLDKSGNALPITVLTNGNGQVMVRAAGIQANQDYFIQISGRGSTLGNYALAASYDDITLTRTSVLAGDLSADTPFQAATMYVARPQLFSFAMDSQTAALGPGVAPIWATVFDDKHRTVAFLGSDVGQYRSGSAVLLQPGTYFIEIEGRGPDGSGSPNASFTLYADRISDPVGPPVLPPGTQPAFPTDPVTGLFIYPGQPPTASPVIIVPPPSPLPPPPSDPVNVPVDLWFWPPDYLPTNPLNPLDSSGDGFVTPLDALVVINFLNQSGAGADPLSLRLTKYLDTSGDGFISAIDALLVINRLNSPPSAAPAGEGESAFIAPQTTPVMPAALAPAPALVDVIFAQSLQESISRKHVSRRWE
jgi:hypothetical protein